MKVFFEKRAERFLKKCDEKLRNRLFEKISCLAENPFPSGEKFKKLIGKKDTFRLRVGEYRILYSVDFSTETIFLRDIFHEHDRY